MGNVEHTKTEGDRQYWWIEKVDRVIVLRFRDDIALADIDMQHTWRLWEFLDRLVVGPDRVLHVQFTSTHLNHDAFVKLWEHFRRIANDTDRTRLELIREDHAMQRWIAFMRDPRLFTVGAYQGELDINFLGLLLACDYRILAKDSVFVNHGRLPGTNHGTAVPWLLTRILKPGDVLQILLSCERLSARRAFDLGLIHRLTNPRSHVYESLQITRDLAASGVTNLLTLKRELIVASEPLEKYFRSEGAGFNCMPAGLVDPPTCARCGYNLTGNVSGKCPECGWPTDVISCRMT